MELKDLMEQFGKTFGLSDLKPDETGIYRVEIDDMTVLFAVEPGGACLVTCGEVGELPAEGRERLFRVLLESMYMGKATGGAMFSIASETDKLVLHRTDPLDGLDHESFAVMLDRFVNLLEQWRGILADFGAVAADQAKAAEKAMQDMRQFNLGDFMQV